MRLFKMIINFNLSFKKSEIKNGKLTYNNQDIKIKLNIKKN